MPFNIYDVTTYTNKGVSFNRRSICKRSNGELWCLWASSHGTSLSLSYSTDSGKTWTKFGNVAAESFITGGTLAVDSQDNIHIVWAVLYGIRYNQLRANNTFVGVYLVSGTGDSTSPSIAIDSQDNVHIVFNRDSGEYIIYRKRSNLGIWSSIEAISRDYYNSAPMICVDSNDTLHVVYVNQHDYPKRAVYYSYKLLTQAWSIGNLVYYNSGYDQNNPCICLDASEDVHITWQGQPYNYAYKSGVSWIPELTPFVGYTGISLAINTADIRIVTAIDSSGKNTYHEKSGASWLTPQDIEGGINHIVTSNSLMWAKHPIIAEQSTNISQTGTLGVWTINEVRDVPQTNYVRFFDTTTVTPTIGSAQLKGWTTGITGGGRHNKGMQTSWYRPTINRIQG